ncbi:glutaredoxin 3 [Ensifer aridi]|uniref:glutaredoxin 3 n=1 Tax=Ensifer aridi TaxID=1708715 RepID=UPI00047C309D|nr:glutaredoxin 3 [Ensifer aridi]
MWVKEQLERMASVVIYTRQFCGYCTRAKKLLESKAVDFIEHDATFDPGLRQEMIEKSKGGRTFPQIIINDVPVGGCDELHALDRTGRLDEMLAA